MATPPLPQTARLLTFLEGWETVVNRLQRHFQIMLEEEKRQVHMHNNSNKELCAPISTFREDGNVQDLLKDLYLQSVVLSSISSSTVTFLQAQTIAQLHQLALQIKTKIHDHKKEFTALDNTLISARSTTTELQQRLTASLEQSTIKSSSSASAASIIDPWLAKIALKRHLTFCTKKHKEWMQQLQQQQHSIS